MKTHYLYQHIRLDTNEIFYIGIGTKSKRKYKTFISTYYRAHRKNGRNQIWKRITSVTEYKIEIVFESENYEDVKKMEKQLIKKYGKKTNLGMLSNITDGGDGTIGVSRPKGKESKFSKEIFQYSLDGKFIKKWSCGYEIETELKYFPNSIYNCCNNKNKSAYGFQWKYYFSDIIDPVQNGYSKKIYQFNLKNELIKIWNSATEASVNLLIDVSGIRDSANPNRKLKSYKKFIWKYDSL